MLDPTCYPLAPFQLCFSLSPQGSEVLPLRCETRWNHESAPHMGARIILYERVFDPPNLPKSTKPAALLANNYLNPLTRGGGLELLPLRCETRWNHESAPHLGAIIILY